MFTATDFGTAIHSAMRQLQTVQSSMSEITCPPIVNLTVNMQELTLERIEELIDDVPSGYHKDDKGNDYVYVVRVKSGPNDLIATLGLQLEEARKNADDYCRVNKEHIATDTLYVGRSGTLKARLRQHLGAENRGIFSMHFQRWATRNEAEICTSFMKFENKEDLLVQAIEDGLWASLRPAFGRKGER